MDVSLYSAALHFQCWVSASNLIFGWKLRDVFCRDDTEWFISSLFMLSEAPVIISLDHLMKVMKHSSSNGYLSLQRSITFPVLRQCPKSDFLDEIKRCFWQKWHRMYHMVTVYAVWSSWKHSYTSNEGYETLKQQWVSLFTAQHRISSAERVHKSWYFAWTFRVVYGRNDTWLTIRCLYMLSEAPVRLPRHLMKVMKHSSSNGCLSL